MNEHGKILNLKCLNTGLANVLQGRKEGNTFNALFRLQRCALVTKMEYKQSVWLIVNSTGHLSFVFYMEKVDFASNNKNTVPEYKFSEFLYILKGPHYACYNEDFRDCIFKAFPRFCFLLVFFIHNCLHQGIHVFISIYCFFLS